MTYRPYSEIFDKDEAEEETKKTVLTFAQTEGRPSDSIRYKKSRRTPSARMRRIMSKRNHGTEKRRLRAGGSRWGRGRVQVPDDRNVLAPIQRGEKKKEEKQCVYL